MTKSLDRVGPSVRRLLAEAGLSRSQLIGTGPRGILVKGDILTAIKSGKKVASSGVADKTSLASSSSVLKAPSSVQQQLFDNFPTSHIRKVIAKRLLESKHDIPHIYLNADAVIDPILAIRKQLLDEHGIKVSLNDFVIRAAALALKAVPEANGFWDESAQEVVRNSAIDIAIAVSTDKGLMTPIVRQADKKSLSLISAEVKSLAEKARSGKLAPNEFQGGTFSISNLGMFAVDRFYAIVNPPQACILAVGKGEKVVIWEEDVSGFGKPTSVTRMSMTLSADHRILNADIGGTFVQSLIANLSDPGRMLL